MKIKINVTKNHIGRGEMADPYSCPVALAIKSKLSTKTVEQGEYSIGRGRLRLVHTFIDFPTEVTRFITHFDMHHKVKPFSFVIAIPNKFLKPKKK